MQRLVGSIIGPRAVRAFSQCVAELLQNYILGGVRYLRLHGGSASPQISLQV